MGPSKVGPRMVGEVPHPARLGVIAGESLMGVAVTI